MSGDVQPRKRKDKKKKKEGSLLGNVHEPIPTPKFKGKSYDEDSEATPVVGSIDPGEKIHVHNDHGIGGNICVKIIFFCLLGALVATVGIIFIHSRGSTDVDLPSVEDSRFADYFTGWLDDVTDDHGHDEHELVQGEDDGHDEEEEHTGGGGGEEEEDEEEEERSAEEATERSEEEEHGEETAEEGSSEVDDVKEENADDDEEEDEDDDGKDTDEDNEDDSEPKFKVIHRFKHFFNQRKQQIKERSEDSGERKMRVVEAEDGDDEEEKEVVLKRIELRKKWKEDEKKGILMRKTVEDQVRKRKAVEEQHEEDEEEASDELDEEVEDGNVEEKEGSDESVKEANEKDVDDEEQEDSDEDVKETDEDEEKEESDEEENLDDEDNEELGEDVKESDEEDEDTEESDEQAAETHEKIEDINGEEEDGDVKDDGSSEREEEEEKDEEKSTEANLGLDEIDESEEAMKEEESFLLGEESPAESSVRDEEVEVVESKIMDIEEKLNQILREKRKKMEQRKMELEEIEMESAVEEATRDEKGDDEGDEEDEESYNHGVAVKVIVGIALIVVAHLVLIKKWKSMGSVPSDEKTEGDETKQVKCEEGSGVIVEPVISRRQTLVPEATDLNEYFGDEGDEEIEEEEEEEEDENEDVGEEEEEEEEEGEEEEDYSGEETVVKNARKWMVDYPNRMQNLRREEEEEEEEYTEEEEDEEELDDEEEEEEEEEDMEEDDYEWKRLEPVRTEVEEEEEVAEAPPIPPPRRSHMTSGERGGPQGIDDFAQVNEPFLEPWDGFGSSDQGEEQSQSGEREEEEDEAQEKSEDEIFKEEFKFAEDQLDNNPSAALKKYELILSRCPESVNALIGRAKALDKIAEKEKSNQFLREAINAYRILLTKHEDALAERDFLLLSERCIDRMRFRGFFKSAVEIHKGLIRKFPDNPKYRNDLAVTYLFLNNIESARDILRDTLTKWPKNGFALVHYGFILKTADNKHAEAADYLMAGIRSREPGVIDGRFFFHLGDALNRLGRGKEAMEWYEQGVKEGLFLSKYQRSLYNVNRLKGQPWWTHRETTYQDFFKKLEDDWEKIRNEGLTLLHSKGVNLFKEEAENLKDTGDWRQLDLYFRGTRQANCDRAPFTCSLIASFPPASTCTRGQVKFSVMLPSTHVWPHCGPTNCRLRSHLGLVVPKNTFIRVAEETRSWEEGKVMIFDDSFEHEVWHNGTGARLVLIVDVWHPELTLKERNFLSPI